MKIRRITNAAWALFLGMLISSILAVMVLLAAGVATFAFQGGYGGIAIGVILAACSWLGGTFYFTRTLWRSWSLETTPPEGRVGAD